MKSFRQFNESLFNWKQKKQTNNVKNDDVIELDNEIGNRFDNIGYTILDGTGIKSTSHLVSNNKDYYLFISPKKDNMYEIQIGDNDSPVYHQKVLAEESFPTLDDIIEFVETNYNGNTESTKERGNPPGW